jgi:hypothetical protein
LDFLAVVWNLLHRHVPDQRDPGNLCLGLPGQDHARDVALVRQLHEGVLDCVPHAINDPSTAKLCIQGAP